MDSSNLKSQTSNPINSGKYWQDYELIDTGNQEKLERFGNIVLSRPEPQAVWKKSLSEAEWEKAYHAKFIRKKGNKEDNYEKGEWLMKRDLKSKWIINFKFKQIDLKIKLSLTSLGHIGIFPEQADNWNYIYNQCIETNSSNSKSQTSSSTNSSNFKSQISNSKDCPRILNLFAYTGISSLVARAAGADVVHVDSVKQVINWSNENAELNNLSNIRWVVEDALKFVKREVNRRNKYNAIILDPPAYGRGPEGEKWMLYEQINELIFLCSKLAEESFFMVLNLYSMGYSPIIADNLISCNFKNIKTKEFGEFYFMDKFNKSLPLGIFHRFQL